MAEVTDTYSAQYEIPDQELCLLDRYSGLVEVLGTEYTLEFLNPKEDPGFKRYPGANGFCDTAAKRIVIRKPSDQNAPEGLPDSSLIEMISKTIRHEIVHAFLYESGLDRNSFGRDKISGPWATNEEMVDWFALQGPKIASVWKEAGCA